MKCRLSRYLDLCYTVVCCNRVKQGDNWIHR